MTDKLEQEEIDERLEGLKIWSIQADKLVTRIEFENYREACFFANTVFSLAEREFHHPEVKVEYGAVEIDLWSHDVEGLTERDFELAEEIEEAVSDIDWE
ncbi:MAG: 4a-hydroxytetrahydrobiopterin dehydratase [Candidatus Nanohaloarchaea archaeon]